MRVICVHNVSHRYPAQERVGGDAKIPSIVYYDQQGAVRAVGAEALLETNLEKAQDEDWVKAEWYPSSRSLGFHNRSDQALSQGSNFTCVQGH
jgi:hypothetical protein